MCQNLHAQTSMAEKKGATLYHRNSIQGKYSAQDAKLDKPSFLRKAPMLGTRALRRSVQEEPETQTTARIRKGPFIGIRTLNNSVQEQIKLENNTRKVSVLGRALERPKEDHTKTDGTTIIRKAPVLGANALERSAFSQTRTYNVAVARKAPKLRTRALKWTMNKSLQRTYRFSTCNGRTER